jgi:hypothetical protein
MRQRLIVGLGVVVGAFALPAAARAQFGENYSVPNQPAVMSSAPILNHLPTGNPGSAGFYTAAEFVFLTPSRAIGDQIVAIRGFYDSQGLITGTPGAFLGSGAVALNTSQLGQASYAPGYRIYLGWKCEDGTSVYASFLQTLDTRRHAGATLVPPGPFRGPASLADTFISSPVYNFPTDYSGPVNDIAQDATTPGNAYGIWNGADEMTIDYWQRYTEAEIAVRTPIFQTEYSRAYAVAGARYAWFYDKFKWRTVDRDVNGVANPQDTAVYENILSQRMYGPMVGCGHEVYAGNAFALSLDATAAALIGVIKEKQKYKLGDEVNPTENRNTREDFRVIPNINVAVNVWWYPLEGVQIRAGYQAMMYFNTRTMLEPIAFNFGALDPAYQSDSFRWVHGLNFGVGLFF